MMQICSLPSPRLCREAPRWRAVRGMTNLPLVWLPLKLSRRYVSSNWTDTPAPATNFGRYRSRHFNRRRRMSHAVRNDTSQRDAQVRNARQSTKHSTYIIHLATGSFDRPIRVSRVLENVRRQSLHCQRWEPSGLCPFLTMPMEPQRGHAKTSSRLAMVS